MIHRNQHPQKFLIDLDPNHLSRWIENAFVLLEANSTIGLFSKIGNFIGRSIKTSEGSAITNTEAFCNSGFIEKNAEITGLNFTGTSFPTTSYLVIEDTTLINDEAKQLFNIAQENCDSESTFTSFIFYDANNRGLVFEKYLISDAKALDLRRMRKDCEYSKWCNVSLSAMSVPPMFGDRWPVAFDKR